jgi:lysophospholipase L1-like esterase
MLKDAHTYRRIIVPITLAILLLFAFAPAALAASSAQPNWPTGLKQHYLALGDSLAFGFQPNGDFTHGYVDDLFQIIQSEGVIDKTNLGCPSESSSTFITGGICSYSPFSSQLAAAVAFLQANAGKVSPITLDIGANDVLPDLASSTCTVNKTKFDADLATLNTNLTGTILPDLKAALTIKGRITGDLVLMNYYDPFQNFCPNTVHFAQRLNAALATDTKAFGFFIVNVFGAFGGATTPNPTLCNDTWICTASPPGPDIHPNILGYSVIANTFAAALPDKQ